MPLAIGDLVDPDPIQLVQAGVVDSFGDDPHDDVREGLPGDAQQPGDGGLVHALGEERDDVFEVASVAGSRNEPTAPGSVRTRLHRGQQSRRISASSNSRHDPRSRWRHRRIDES